MGSVLVSPKSRVWIMFLILVPELARFSKRTEPRNFQYRLGMFVLCNNCPKGLLCRGASDLDVCASHRASVRACVRASVRASVRPCHFFSDHFWSAKTQIPLGKRSKKGPENGPFLHIV